ncbi:retrovirus-related pol polyprotein from transposon TNT 1-94 [Tanacetum coccineum]
MFKLDLDLLAPRLLKNKDAHIDYLKYTQEHADILRGIVEQAKVKQPLDNALDFACKHAKRIQELLVESSKTPDSNTPVLPSTGLKSSTSASRSQPIVNKKNDRISQTPSSNMNNKVKVQLRRANLSSNKKNHVKDPICDANVKHTMLNANSELICVKCEQCMFDANHDVCFLDFVNDVNVRSKFKSAKQSQHHNIWKPTGYPDCSLVFGLRMLKTYDREPLSAYELFGQLCDLDLEVAFWKNTCFIRNLDGVDLLLGSRDTNLYTVSLDDMLKTSLISKDGLARGIPKLKFKKDHLCSACALGKSKKSSHQPKAEDTNQEKLYILHMDLCGPMRVESINGKKSKDEAPDAIIKCIKNIQVCLNAIIRNVRTDNGIEFVNQIIRELYENVSITHQTSVARTPQQNGIVERRNRTLVEAARTMLIFSKALLFLWAEAINTTCYTQNRSLIRL